MGWSGFVIILGSDTSMGCTDAVGLDLWFGVFKPRPRVIMLSSSPILPIEMSSNKMYF